LKFTQNFSNGCATRMQFLGQHILGQDRTPDFQCSEIVHRPVECLLENRFVPHGSSVRDAAPPVFFIAFF
jgi:hypothetical protein